jgi:2-keto-4-pentenoate hydratase/2-oxohepta-3-ene-1,7-dioic acid hydratase in catechol pathway
MKLAIISGDRAAIVTDKGVVDVSQLFPSGTGALGSPWLRWLDQGGTVAELSALDLTTFPTYELDQVQLQAPLVRPGKIVAAPVNYLDHKVEMSEQKTIAEYGVFLKANSSIIGPGEEIVLPYSDKRIDQEGELGVVIGRTASNVSPDQALSYVFGYTGVLDISLRSTEDRSTRKSFNTFTPVGPWITTADEIPDPDRLELRCWVDDDLRQHTNTSELIFSVPELIAYTSSVMTLYPGDIIATGTPAGVGSLSNWQTIRLDIEAVGSFSVRVTSKGAIPYSERPGTAVLAID